MSVCRGHAVALFLSLVVTVAANGEAAGNTEALIRALDERIAFEAEISGSFEQKKYISVLPEPLQSHGKFAYGHDSGLIWETLAPIANRLVFDKQGISQSVEGKTVWEIDGGQPAVVTITQVISSVLAADWATLSEYFSIAGSVGEQGWKLQLEPRDEMLEQIVDSISVTGDRVLSAMTLLESNGDRSEIVFTVQRLSEH